MPTLPWQCTLTASYHGTARFHAIPAANRPPPPLLMNIVAGIWSWQFAYDKKAIMIYVMYNVLGR